MSKQSAIISLSPKLEGLIHRSIKKTRKSPRLGWGECWKCNCQRFEGNDSTCANSGCGHSYDDHYGY
ncbi:MAG: hypothetical protein ACFKPT_25540 [Gloeotrichia echinulata GP01]|nr:hypothetical protein [Gloeotrichia echinulata DEX184]